MSIEKRKYPPILDAGMQEADIIINTITKRNDPEVQKISYLFYMNRNKKLFS